MIKKIPLKSIKILYRGIFIATFKRTYIQDQARLIIVTSLLSYETSPYFSWREKSLLPKFLSQLEPCYTFRTLSVRPSALRFCALTLVPFDLFSSNFAQTLVSGRSGMGLQVG